MIRKLPDKKSFGLYSGLGRRLGVFPSRAAALRRERQINFFKSNK
jgi:hypothetical protein